MLLVSEWHLQCQTVSRRLAEICAEYDLTYDQFLVLEQIIVRHQDTPGEIATVFGTSAPVASRKVNLLQEKRLIRKDRAFSEDQRLVRIKVTKAGNSVYQQVSRVIQAKLDEDAVIAQRPDIAKWGS